MTTSALRRQVKNIVHNYSEAEIKVREATSNDSWGPPSSLMSEIADLTFNTVAFAEIMGMIWRRLNDSGKNWRHVYKALTLLDYLIKTGSEKVAHQCRENLYTIQTLKDFQYTDRDGKDQGINVREKVKQVMGLLKDEEKLKQERAHALKTKERMSTEGTGISSSQQLSYGRRTSQYGEDYGRPRGSPSSFNSSSSSPQHTSDLEQARPQTTGEEELQLQLALAMSREEAEKVMFAAASCGVDSLCNAFEWFPAWIPQLPVCLPGLKSNVEPAGASWVPSADPWAPIPAASGDPLSQMAASINQTSTGPWDLPPIVSSSSSDPWEKTPLSSSLSSADAWVKASPPSKGSADATSAADPWGGIVDSPPRAGKRSTFSLSCLLFVLDLDLFGDPIPSTKQNGVKNTDVFDLAGLGDSLTDPNKERKDCKTPESFLGPTASSLVNLDSLVVAPTTLKTHNPFLSGRSWGTGPSQKGH
uniref:Epsin 3 n=1 Tax=Gopherus evgoodei TaxID=1825980 RepID=A0A8C4WE48_9SAUR